MLQQYMAQEYPTHGALYRAVGEPAEDYLGLTAMGEQINQSGRESRRERFLRLAPRRVEGAAKIANRFRSET